MQRVTAAAGLALVWLAGASAQQSRVVNTGEDLVGLYGSETVFGPQVRGPITLERTGTAWTARVGGFEVSMAGGTGDVRLALPGGQGELRAHVENAGRVVRGFWIQPAGNFGQFASPVTLDRVQPDVWRGTVRPLDETFSLYLLVEPQPDGSRRGVFRNPEMNWDGRAQAFRVARDGDSLTFADPATGKTRFTQAYDPGGRQITFDFGGPVVLTPRSRDQAVGFYPRSSAVSYSYRSPIPQGDGWATARAADVGLDATLLSGLVESITTADPAGPAPRIHSLLVARHGKLVLEEYFFGFTADRLHDLRSASKTFTSVMAGAAMALEPSFSADTPVAALFPRDPGAEAPNPRVARITVGQLLTHSSGLACDDNDGASPGNEDVMQQQRKQRDWYRFALDLPVVREPGSTYTYCSAGINLVGGAIGRVTKSWLPDFFDTHMARPLQIERYAMNLMPTGEAYAGGGIHLRPRDFLKFGQMYLDGGMWNGTRVVLRSWVERSTARQIDAPNGSTDGFGWHRYLLTEGGRSYQEYEASGNGGQFLIVVPELDLTIVITAGNYNEYVVWKTFRNDLVPRYILAAVQKPQERIAGPGH